MMAHLDFGKRAMGVFGHWGVTSLEASCIRAAGVEVLLRR